MPDLRAIGGDQRATPKGQPGPDIEEKRRKQAARKWDSKTVQAALQRIYQSRQHAEKEAI